MFVMPETFDGLTVTELQTHIDAALDALRALGITEDTTDDELLAQGDVLMGNLDTLGEALTAAEEAASAATARKDRAKAIAERSQPAPAKASDTPEPDP